MSKLDLLQGTLDLMVLKTLAAMGQLHGYGIARRIEQVSGNEVLLNQGTIYASLVRLEQAAGSHPAGACLLTIAKPVFTRSPKPAAGNWRRTRVTGSVSPV